MFHFKGICSKRIEVSSGLKKLFSSGKFNCKELLRILSKQLIIIIFCKLSEKIDDAALLIPQNYVEESEFITKYQIVLALLWLKHRDFVVSSSTMPLIQSFGVFFKNL